MKLNQHLIVTIPDFARYFTFAEFWNNRWQFVRDFHPNKVYYWDDSLVTAYHQVAEWIEDGDNADFSVVEGGLNALDLLLGGTLDRSTVVFSGKINDLDGDIIDVCSNMQLPVVGKKVDPKTLRLQKLQFSQSCTVAIGDKKHGIYRPGDVAYAISASGQFVDVLPNKEVNRMAELSLIDNEGVFASTLLVQNALSGARNTFDGIVSFGLLDDGYIYIDAQGKPIFMTKMVPKMLFRSDNPALFVRTQGMAALMLFKGGELRTSLSMHPINNVINAWFDGPDTIKYMTADLETKTLRLQ